MEKPRWIDHLTYDELAYLLMLVDHPVNNILGDDTWGNLRGKLDATVRYDDDLDDTISMLQIGTGRHEWHDIHDRT